MNSSRFSQDPPWLRSAFFQKLFLPALYFTTLLVLGVWGFRDYYEFVESSGREHNPAGIASPSHPLSPESPPPGSPDHPLDSKVPYWYKPVRSQTIWDNCLLAIGLVSAETLYQPEAGYSVPIPLTIARIMGILVLPAAFFVLAYRILRDDLLRLKIFIWGRLPWFRVNVLCGLGWQGREMAFQILSGGGGRKLAVIEKDPDNPFAATLRDFGAAVLFKDAATRRALVNAGIRHAERVFVTSDDDETNCRIVRQVAAVLGNWNKPHCLLPGSPESGGRKQLKKRCKCHSKSICMRCYASIRDPLARSLLENSTKNSRIAVQTFDPEQLTARRLHARHPFCPVLQDGGPQHAHVVIIGFTPMAQAILFNALQVGHFTTGSRLEITVICREANKARQAALRRFPALDPTENPRIRLINDCPPDLRNYVFPKIEFVEEPQADSHWLDDDFALYRRMERGWYVSVYACLDDGVNSWALVQGLYDKILNRRNRIRNTPSSSAGNAISGRPGEKIEDFDVQVFFYYNYPGDAATEFDGNAQAEFRVQHFGGFDEDCSVDVLECFPLDDLARDILKFYRIHFNEEFKAWFEEGPRSCWWSPRSWRKAQREAWRKCLVQQYWDYADEWEHESNRHAADHVIVKLRCLGMEASLKKNLEKPHRPESSEKIQYDPALLSKAVENPKTVRLLAETEHRRWCAERLLSGWRPFRYSPQDPGLNEEKIHAWFVQGESKPARKEKRHICLVPFDDLPVDPVNQTSEQQRDFKMIEALPSLLNSIS